MSNIDPALAQGDNNNNGIIASAEQLAASFWQATESKEPEQAAPPSWEAKESEANQVASVARAVFLDRGCEDFEEIKILRNFTEDIPGFAIYDVAGKAGAKCGNCNEIHWMPTAITVVRLVDGAELFALDDVETILNKREERQRPGQLIELPNTPDVLGKIGEVLMAAAKHAAQPHDAVEPAVEEAPPAEQSSESAEPPAQDVGQFRVDRDNDNEQLGLLRRAWNWLRTQGGRLW